MEKQNLIGIKIHSITDLITNSSTTIYTHSERSLQAAKDMVSSFLSVLAPDKKVEDIFKFVVMFDRGGYDSTIEYLTDYSSEEVDFSDELKSVIDKGEVEKIADEVRQGLIDKPEWMLELEDSDDWDEYDQDTTLFIIPKSPEYVDIAKKMSEFLYSTECDEGSY